MQRLSLMVAVFMSIGSTAFGVIWTESFETGVGRLSNTRDHADVLTTWNSTEESIDGTFYRVERVDMRYAEISDLDEHSGIIGFTAVVQPLNAGPHYAGSAPAMRVGFMNSSAATTNENHFFVSFNYRVGGGLDITLGGQLEDGTPYTGGGNFHYEFGNTYFVIATADFDNQDASLTVYEGDNSSGTLIGSTTIPFLATGSLTMNALGICNVDRLSPDEQKPFEFRLHELSYMVPEPSTALLLGLSSLVVIRRRAVV